MFFFAVLAVLLLASCSSNDDTTTNPPYTPVAINISNTIGTYGRAATDIQSSQIAKNVKIGLFSFVFGNTTMAQTKKSIDEYGYINIPYISDGDGKLKVCNQPTYYPADGTTVDLYAYAPYNKDFTPKDISQTTGGNILPFTVNSNQYIDTLYEASDLLWATPLLDQASSTTERNLDFTHKLSKITFTLNTSDEKYITTEDLEAAEISILNIKPTTSLNVATGSIADASGSKITIKVQKAYSSSLKASAIIVPQTITEGTPFIQIKIGTNVYEYAIPSMEEMIFRTAQHYSYIITVTPTGLIVTTAITDWTVDEEHSGNASQTT